MPHPTPPLRTPLAAAAALTALVAGGSTEAQMPGLDAVRLQILEHQTLQAQARALDAQREADAALARLQAEQTLRGLAADRAAGVSSAAWLADLPPLPPQPPTAIAAIDSQLAVDSERLLQLQGEALARSNARILAVRPAL